MRADDDDLARVARARQRRFEIRGRAAAAGEGVIAHLVAVGRELGLEVERGLGELLRMERAAAADGRRELFHMRTELGGERGLYGRERRQRTAVRGAGHSKQCVPGEEKDDADRREQHAETSQGASVPKSDPGDSHASIY